MIKQINWITSSKTSSLPFHGLESLQLDLSLIFALLNKLFLNFIDGYRESFFFIVRHDQCQDIKLRSLQDDGSNDSFIYWYSDVNDLDVRVSKS